MSDNKSKLKQFFATIQDQYKTLFEAPADATPVAATPYKLEDGTEVMIDKVEVGGVVKVGDVLAPAGTHVLEDGTSLIVDENGVIVEVKAKEAPAANPAEQPVVEVEDQKYTALNGKVGELENRVTTLEQANQFKDQAITDQKQLMGKMLELMEQFMEVPATEVPATTKKRFSFSRTDIHDKSKSKFANALAALQAESKN